MVNGSSALSGSRAKSKPVIRPSFGWPLRAGESGAGFVGIERVGPVVLRQPLLGPVGRHVADGERLGGRIPGPLNRVRGILSAPFLPRGEGRAAREGQRRGSNQQPDMASHGTTLPLGADEGVERRGPNGGKAGTRPGGRRLARRDWRRQGACHPGHPVEADFGGEIKLSARSSGRRSTPDAAGLPRSPADRDFLLTKELDFLNHGLRVHR